MSKASVAARLVACSRADLPEVAAPVDHDGPQDSPGELAEWQRHLIANQRLGFAPYARSIRALSAEAAVQGTNWSRKPGCGEEPQGIVTSSFRAAINRIGSGSN